MSSTPARPTPRGLLSIGRVLVTRGGATVPGVSWTPVAALVARQGIEAAVARFWQKRRPEVNGANWRVRFLCLHGFMSDDHQAREAYGLWSALSSACHHRPYELPPSNGEVLDLIARTERVVRILEA